MVAQLDNKRQAKPLPVCNKDKNSEKPLPDIHTYNHINQ